MNKRYKLNHTVMKGTNKQIKYATDLINELQKKVDKFEAKGKLNHPKVQRYVEELEIAKSLDSASQVIHLRTVHTGSLEDFKAGIN